MLSGSDDNQNCYKELSIITTNQPSRSQVNILASRYPNVPKSLNSFFSPEFARPQELRILEFLVARFDTITAPCYLDRRMTILAQALPLAATSPPLAYAFLACGSALMSKMTSEDAEYQLSRCFQTMAISRISSDMMTSPTEVMALAVMLLHIYEETYCDIENPNLYHLKGGLALMDLAIARGPLITTIQHMAMELCLYHIARSSTFSGVKSEPLPDDYISSRLVALDLSARSQGKEPSWRSDSFLGFTPELFDIVFRLSLLRRKVPLQDLDQLKADQIAARLKDLRPRLFSMDGLPPVTFSEFPPDMLYTAQLYHLACGLLLLKICKVSLRENDLEVQILIEEAMQIFRTVSLAALRSPPLAWPLIILSCGTTKKADQQLLRSPIEYSSIADRLGSSMYTLRFLDCVWHGDGGNNGVGLDALFHDELLCTVFF
ncbi:hypothetical protein BP6252_08077 [Coleophoma cylindrospora]|uniref:Transcription factor domain-containing protein n=1 Tax=Coleophoma cylindrospora TaxID=1849047 RepID=A0A3D8RCB1_9HELO|nr:hypothetical protein BP6252_08077 [Coleophoma cylindrospora]